MTAQAQQFNGWLVSESDECGLITNKMLQQIPANTFAIAAIGRETIGLSLFGHMHEKPDQPQNGEVQFAERTVAASTIRWELMEEPDFYGYSWEIPSEYLVDLAQSESIRMVVDGDHVIATLTLAERGQAVAHMARCMRGMGK